MRDYRSRVRAGVYTALTLILALAVPPGAALAEETAADWKPEPPPPMPEKWDWVQMTSEEWLKGEFLTMYDESLEFDSDEFGVLTVDWGDVAQVRTAQTVQVGFLGGDSATGKLYVDGDKVRVIGDADRTFDKSRVLSIVAGEPKEINFWSFKLTFGLNLRSGNTNQIESSNRTRIARRTIKNRITFEYLANYNRTENEAVADNQRATAGWDKFINDRFYVAPVFLEYFRDPFQNIDQRWTIGAGVGYDLIETKKIDWSVSGGPAYQQTRFDSVVEGEPESESTPALVAGTVVDIEVTKNLDWDYEYRFQWVNSQSGTYNHHMVTGLDFELTSVLDFNLTLVWDRIENPRENADGTFPESNDYRMNVGITLDF